MSELDRSEVVEGRTLREETLLNKLMGRFNSFFTQAKFGFPRDPGPYVAPPIALGFGPTPDIGKNVNAILNTLDSNG